MKMTQEQMEQTVNKVLNKLMNFEVPDIQQLSRGPRNQGLLVHDLDINIWNWPQGVGLYGLEKLQTYYGDQRYDDFLDGWFRRQLREGEPIRNINTTAPYLVLQALADRTENETYHEMCTRRANWLMNGLPRTRENGFQHVVQDLNNQQLWVDTLFMSVLFLAREGKRQGRYDWCQEAVHQILVHIKYLYDKKIRLLFHGWSFERMDNFGGIYWGRGNSWFSYGILELLENLEDTLDGGTREFMLETYVAQMEALRDVQDETGLWHTILDDPDSYLEVSAAAGFCAAMYKGMRIGCLPMDFLPCAEKALQGIAANIDADGTVQNVSVGTTVGMDGEHYKRIALAPIGYGQSMTALALIEAMEFRKAQEEREG